VAGAIVRWRDAHGAFRSRRQLLDVTGLGPRTFEQAAGFLRIRDGENPLDMTGVHPETYPVVERILAATQRPIAGCHGPWRAAEDAQARDLRRRPASARSRSRTSWPSWKSRAATRGPTSSSRASTTASMTSRTCSPACCCRAR
jgi:hypothetical protein